LDIKELKKETYSKVQDLENHLKLLNSTTREKGNW